MGRKLIQPTDDESSDIIRKYERFIKGQDSGYFDVQEMEAIVEYYLRKGKTKESTSALDFGLKLHPNSSELQSKRAKIYLIAGENQKAQRILNTFGESQDYEITLLRIEAGLKLGNKKDALQLAMTVIESENEDVDNIALDLGYIFIAQLEFDSALKFLQIGDKFYSKNTDLLFELAFCYEQLTQTDLAIEVYNRIIDIDPYSAEAWFNLGQLNFALNDFVHAINAYDFVLVINENDPIARIQKAHAHFQLFQYYEAIEIYEDYENLEIEPWQAFLFIGECYEKLELFDQAIRNYEQALDILPDNYEALIGLTICFLEKEYYAESLKFIRRALEIQPETHDGWVYLAEALTGLDDIENALLAYLKSISIEPNQPDTLMSIANICMDKLEFKMALKYYLLAYDLDNTLEHINLFIAVAFYKTGNETATKIYLRKAIDENLEAAELFQELCPDCGENMFE